MQIEEFLKHTLLTNNNRAINGNMSIFRSNLSGFVRLPPTSDHGGAIYASAANVTSYFNNNEIAGGTNINDKYGGAAAYIYQGTMTI